jgi:hypothetical protein
LLNDVSNNHPLKGKPIPDINRIYFTSTESQELLKEQQSETSLFGEPKVEEYVPKASIKVVV